MKKVTVHLRSAMWQFTNTSVLRCGHMIGFSVSKSVWPHRVMYQQLQSCNFGITKPCLRYMSGYIYRWGQFSYYSRLNMLSGQSVGFLNLCTTCARRSGCMKFLWLQRGVLLKQLRHASSTRTVPSVVSNPVQQASKKGIPKASEVYRLLSLAKPEKWILLGENPLSFLAVIFCHLILCILTQNDAQKFCNFLM